jgi:hypothetical protein
MDIWKYFDVTHRKHVLCNPLAVEKLDELLGFLGLPDDARVVRIGGTKPLFTGRIRGSGQRVEEVGICGGTEGATEPFREGGGSMPGRRLPRRDAGSSARSWEVQALRPSSRGTHASAQGCS